MESSATRNTSEDGVIAVAAAENHLVEGRNAAWSGVVAAGVNVRVVQKNLELCLVLDRALEPARLALEAISRLGDSLLSDLERTTVSGLS